MKRIATLILLSIALFSISNNIKAQIYVVVPNESRFGFGGEVGLNVSKIGGNPSGRTLKLGYNVGLKVNYKVLSNQSFYVETGVKFTTKGLKAKFDKNRNDRNIEAMYILAPLHAVYMLSLANNINLLFKAGPYIAYGVGGKSEYMVENNDGNYEKKRVNTFGDEGIAKRGDAGVSFGGAIEYKQFSLIGTVEQGLRNVVDAGNKKTRNVSFGIGYRY